MSNLKVNARTNIKEFKRKHNKLVEQFGDLDLSAAKITNVADIKTLSNSECEELKCGDIVTKEDSAGKHAYVVTYKKSNEMCLTYFDHTIIEEVYYEKSTTWSYIQTDICRFSELGTTVIANPSPEGTTALTGLQVGNEKYKINVGSHIYQHTIQMGGSNIIQLYSRNSEPITTNAALASALFPLFFSAAFINNHDYVNLQIVGIKLNDMFNRIIDLVCISVYEATPSTNLILKDISTLSPTSDSVIKIS